jgi:uncharacterized iron-regulated protein
MKKIYCIGEIRKGIPEIQLEIAGLKKEYSSLYNLLIEKIEKSRKKRLDITCKTITEKGIKRIFLEEKGRDLETVAAELNFPIQDIYCLENYNDEEFRKFEKQVLEIFKLGKKEELQKILNILNAKREKYWIKVINENYINPSLVICGTAHLDKNGNFPKLLRESDYDVEIVYLEKNLFD